MKKLFLLLVFLLVSNIAFADKQEWIDKKHDFSQDRIIYLSYEVKDDIKNGIAEKESLEIFKNIMNERFNKKLSVKGYKVLTLDEIINDKNMLSKEELQKEIISNNVDLVVAVKLDCYEIGSIYKEGYTYSVPVTRYEYVYTPNGTISVPVTENQVHSVRGGMRPSVMVKVRFDLLDTNTNEVVWARIDNRRKTNEDEFDNTKPKDVFGRIIKSFCSDAQKRFR